MVRDRVRPFSGHLPSRAVLLRRLVRIPYWTKQREQVLKLGRRGLASALAREIALNI